ncbi:hypothetical protein SKAU_G00354680 [Synaphobranchus kaupii]|uniref:Mitochondrial 28S ribosomal protein S36 n=1 Tax=Synaphobranchus kaupii TaxID=118154 RepID=A0A9Q1EH50_SYNKA|nr:hypothetical protein SKAU_G00354680 [Synaphobranchus kaupii]
MAATARVIVQAVRPHLPLIKFPDRLGVSRPNVQEAMMTMVAPAQSSGTHSLPQPAGQMAAPPRPLSTAPPSRQVPGPPDTAASIANVPLRYRRKLLAAEEMDYIQRGGPE